MSYSRRGLVFVQLLITLIGSLAMILFLRDCISYHAIHGFDTRGVELEGVSDEMRVRIRRWKDDADLVLRARVIGIDNQGVDKGPDAVTTYGYYWLAIEDIERGFYTHPEIKVYIGWTSNVVPEIDYPPYLKRSYRRNDRMRIYLNFDRSRQMYYTPGSYYCIESLDNTFTDPLGP